MILTPGSRERSVNLVPLRDLATLLDADTATIVVQLVGNLLVFFVLGLCLPVRFAALAGLARVLAVAAAGSVFVEVLQYTLDLGRVSSVDDVLLNAAGAGLGALASRPWWRREAAAASGAGTGDARVWRYWFR